MKWNIDAIAKHAAEIVTKESGNILGENQFSMVLSRIKKRMIDLGNIDANDYYNYLTSNYKKESSYLVGLLTTHHTFFFREFCHFEFILENLSSIVERVKERGEKKIKIFSAACSRGHEVYSLAMFFDFHLKNFPGIDYEIWGTDIDEGSVKIAQNGVYNYNEVKSIPQNYLANHWKRGTGDISHFAKIKDEIKSKCKFSVMNLMTPKSYLEGSKFDIVFCRNAFIYFESDVIFKIVNEIRPFIYQNGFFITGLSESLKTLDIPKQTLAPSVYCFDIPQKETVVEKNTERKIVEKVVSLIPKPIRILTVDDSQSVLKLLAKIFQGDNSFELVGSAKNGVEAEEFLKKNKVDAMTLDIHMPEMDGVEYLKKNFKKGHPHVVVVSSASREDTRYAQEPLKNGACDFVEKPALNNLNERSEEIKNKIKMAFLRDNSKVLSNLDSSFKSDFKIKNVERKARMFFLNFSDVEKVSLLLKELKENQPPCFVFLEGNSNYLDLVKDKLSELKNVSLFQEGMKLESDNIYICDASEHLGKVIDEIKSYKKSVGVFGICSSKVSDKIIHMDNAQVLIEDLPETNLDLREVVTDIFPWTSFSHVGTEFLAKD